MTSVKSKRSTKKDRAKGPVGSTEKSSKKRNRQTLEQQILQDRFVSTKDGNKGREREPKRERTEEFLSPSLSKKILQQAKTQQHLEDIDDELEDPEVPNEYRTQTTEDSSDEEKNNDYEDEEAYEQQDIEIPQEDEAILQMFMSEEPERLNLADIIMAKIREKEQNASAEQLESKLDPKVVQVYKGVGLILKRFTSGKIPKAFKVIPSLSNWEEILYLTNPDEWSPPAYYQATRLFASNFNNRMAQRFYNLILLPAVRNDIVAHKKLNFHLYMSLKKALYKSAAFYKGFLLPLCEQKCTLREAAIIASVLSKVSIPVLHSSAALLKIAEMEYSGPNSLFIRVLLDKKYSLPFRVIDALVNHFYGFLQDDRTLPVLWHQSLLVFSQRYKSDLTSAQKEKLHTLTRKHVHHSITDSIKRELVSSLSREDVME